MRGQTVRLVGDVQRALAKKLIDAAPVGAVVNVSEATRTTEQNTRMWAMLSDIARAKPGGRVLSTDKWKALFMDACGHKVEWEPGLEGGVVPVGYRSSSLRKGEMSEIIEAMFAFGAEHDVRWSEPVRREWAA
jgi:hypothetical protein